MNFSKSLRLAACAVIALCGSFGLAKEQPYDLWEGDIVFSSSSVGQGKAIIDASNAPYIHCGIVFLEVEKPMVLEAVKPVGVITLESFMARSTPGIFTARRLKSPVTPDVYQKAAFGGRRGSA